jgi:hypothetical protein
MTRLHTTTVLAHCELSFRATREESFLSLGNLVPAEDEFLT